MDDRVLLHARLVVEGRSKKDRPAPTPTPEFIDIRTVVPGEASSFKTQSQERWNKFWDKEQSTLGALPGRANFVPSS